MSNHILGVYYCPNHDRQQDYDYIRRLQPNTIRVFEPTANKLNKVYAVAPNALYFPRIWEWSEEIEKPLAQQKPIETGIKHARWWDERIKQWYKEGLQIPREKLVIIGLNEPENHVSGAIPDKNTNPSGYAKWVSDTKYIEETLSKYNVAMIKEANNLGLAVCALNLSVGNPTNFSAGELSDWSMFEPIHEVIKNSKHFLGSHEYYYPKLEANWGWHSGRIQHNHWKDINIIIAEFGFEKRLSNLSASQPWGWQGYMSSKEYAQSIVRYLKIIGQDKRIKGVFPFSLDQYNAEWLSLDINPAINDILYELSIIDTYKADLPYDLSWMDNNKPIDPPVTPNPPPIIIPPVLNIRDLIFPVSDVRITQHFGQSLVDYSIYGLKFHNGTDFGCPEGTIVKAVADGIVKFTGYDTTYGNYCRIFHPQHNACSFYAHLKELPTVTIGQNVKQNDKIALSGNTGTGSDGAHLHFEWRLMKDENTYLVIDTGASPKGQVDFYSVLKYINNI